MRLNRAVFLDRDNTLNIDAGYTYRIEDWQFMPGASEAVRLFAEHGWLVIVVSNQSGIGRGYYSEADLLRLEAHVNALLGRSITAWYHCPHLPDDNCDCRKPQPGLILRAAREQDIDLPRSWTLGDRLSDALAGLAAGTRAGLIGTDAPKDIAQWKQIRVWPNLLRAAADIIKEGAVHFG